MTEKNDLDVIVVCPDCNYEFTDIEVLEDCFEDPTNWLGGCYCPQCKVRLKITRERTYDIQLWDKEIEIDKEIDKESHTTASIQKPNDIVDIFFLTNWQDDMAWCPSQCFRKLEFVGDIYYLYLRWRHSDPWQAHIMNAERSIVTDDLFVKEQLYFLDSELDLAKGALIKLATKWLNSRQHVVTAVHNIDSCTKKMQAQYQQELQYWILQCKMMFLKDSLQKPLRYLQVDKLQQCRDDIEILTLMELKELYNQMKLLNKDVIQQ